MKYLKNYGKDKVEVINENSKNLQRSIEIGLSIGKWVIIKTNSEEFDSALDPIFDK